MTRVESAQLARPSPVGKTGPTYLANSAALSGAAVASLLIPALLLLGFGGGSLGFVFVVSSIVIAYAATSVLASLSLLTLLRPSHRAVPVSFAVGTGLVAVGLPAVAVTLFGEWGSSGWYLVFSFYLPSGLVIAAQMGLLASLLARRLRAYAPEILASLALAGSLASPAATYGLVPIGTREGWYLLSLSVLAMSVVCDVSIALWLRRTMPPMEPP